MLAAALALLLPLAAEVSQFRGPDQSGRYEADIPTEWSPEANIAWSVPNPGEGWSQPVYADGKLFVTSAVMKTPPPAGSSGIAYGGGSANRDRRDVSQAEYAWEVRCLDAATGQTLWNRTVREGRPVLKRHSTNTYATETPVTDGQYVAAYFGMHGLYCFTVDGEPVWQKDLGAEPMANDWGTASSPALHEGKILMQVDNEAQSYLAAFDLKTGEELWRTDRDSVSQYGTPYVWRNSQRDEVICVGQSVISYDPATGRELWRIDMNRGRSSATPVADGDTLYVGNELRNRGGRDDGGGYLFAVKAGGAGDITPPGVRGSGPLTNEHIAWGIEEAGVAMASPVLAGGHLYVLERRVGALRCYDAATGGRAYIKRMPGSGAFWGSPIAVGDRVLCPDDDGTIHVVKAGPEFELLASNDLPQVTWSTPTVAGGRLIIRGADTIYAVAR